MKALIKETMSNLHTVLMLLLITMALVALIGLMSGIRLRILITDSMYPSVYKGSLVLINVNSPWDELKEGSIIVFRSGLTEVMHRIAEVKDEGLILRPDNGNGESLVTKDMYVGKEIISFPYIGAMIKTVLQHGKKYIIITALVLIIFGCKSSRFL